MDTVFYNITINITNIKDGQDHTAQMLPHNGTTDAALGSGDNNSTEEESGDSFDINSAFKNLIILLYVLVILVALVGNGCVIYLVVSQRQMRNVTNYFIASLATSDALMALVCIPITFIANVLVESWPFPAWMCPFATYFQIVIVFQNAYTMMAISLERYIAIMYPFKRRLTTGQCFLVIALTWFMSFGTPLPTAVVSRLEPSPDDPNVTKSYCYEVWPDDDKRFTYTMTIMIMQYFLPLAVLTYTYIRIVIVVWLKDQPPHGQLGGAGGGAGGGARVGSRRSVLQHRESSPGLDVRTGKYVDPRKRIIKMMMTVVGIYATCWLPIHIISILGDTNPSIWDHSFMRYFWVSAHWLAMSSATYNPLIYWWMSERFRGGYQYLLKSVKYTCCRCGHHRRPELPFMSFYSQADGCGPPPPPPPPPPPVPIYRNTAQGGRGVGVNGQGCVVAGGGDGCHRNGLAPDYVNGGGGGGGGGRGEGERACLVGVRWEDGKSHKQNGGSFRTEIEYLKEETGETIPLRKTSDPAESGLGSEDGDECEESCPTPL